MSDLVVMCGSPDYAESIRVAWHETSEACRDGSSFAWFSGHFRQVLLGLEPDLADVRLYFGADGRLQVACTRRAGIESVQVEGTVIL